MNFGIAMYTEQGLQVGDQVVEAPSCGWVRIRDEFTGWYILVKDMVDSNAIVECNKEGSFQH